MKKKVKPHKETIYIVKGTYQKKEDGKSKEKRKIN